jgi:hypothetical protein
MSGSNGNVAQFPQAGVPLVGQPFTVESIGVPMNMTLTCNCAIGDDRTVKIIGSVSAACAGCGKVYNALFNPQNGQIQMSVGLPTPKVPS